MSTVKQHNEYLRRKVDRLKRSLEISRLALSILADELCDSEEQAERQISEAIIEAKLVSRGLKAPPESWVTLEDFITELTDKTSETCRNSDEKSTHSQDVSNTQA